jgi:hypothetical protein
LQNCLQASMWSSRYYRTILMESGMCNIHSAFVWTWTGYEVNRSERYKVGVSLFQQQMRQWIFMRLRCITFHKNILLIATVTILLAPTYFIRVVGWVTMLQVGRSRVRSLMKSLHFQFTYLILPAALDPRVDSAPNRNLKETNLNSVAWVREWTLPTELPPPVDEVIANFCG